MPDDYRSGSTRGSRQLRIRAAVSLELAIDGLAGEAVPCRSSSRATWVAGKEPVDLPVDQIDGVLRCVLRQQLRGSCFGRRLQICVHVAQFLTAAKQ
jgi:hypothetical protein